MLSRKNQLILAASLAAFVLLALLFLRVREPQAEIRESGSIATPISTSSVNIGGLEVSGSGGFTIERVETLPADLPALDHKPRFQNPVLTGEQRLLLTEKIAEVQERLKREPDDLRSWLDLALRYKISGDLTAARDVWLFTDKYWPDNYISSHNLAELYAYDFKDYQRAAGYYRDSLSDNPTQIITYLNFYMFSRFVLRDDEAAKAILAEAVQKNPETSAELKYILEHYDEYE